MTWSSEGASSALLQIRVAEAADQRLLDETLVGRRRAGRGGADAARRHAAGADPRRGRAARAALRGRRRGGRRRARLPARRRAAARARTSSPSTCCRGRCRAATAPPTPSAPTADGDLRRAAAHAQPDPAVADWVRERIAYQPGASDNLTTADQTLLARQGVCRDMAHLAVELPARARGAGAGRGRLRAAARARRTSTPLLEAHDGTGVAHHRRHRPRAGRDAGAHRDRPRRGRRRLGERRADRCSSTTSRSPRSRSPPSHRAPRCPEGLVWTHGQTPRPRPSLQLRLVVEAEDFERALAFYRDALGLPEQAAFEAEGDARVVILERRPRDAGAGQPRPEGDDRPGRGRPPRRRRRSASPSRWPTPRARPTTLVDAGAELIAPPVETPWRSLNSRLDAPAGLQITLFEELETLEERAQRPGFGEAATRDDSA